MNAYPQEPAVNFPAEFVGTNAYNALTFVPIQYSIDAWWFVYHYLCGESWSAFFALMSLGFVSPPYRHPVNHKVYQVCCHWVGLHHFYGSHYSDPSHTVSDLQLRETGMYCGDIPLGQSYLTGSDGSDFSLPAWWSHLGDPSIVRPENTALLNITSTPGNIHEYTWDREAYEIKWKRYDKPATKAPSIIPLVVPFLPLLPLPFLFPLFGMGAFGAYGAGRSTNTSAGRRRKVSR